MTRKSRTPPAQIDRAVREAGRSTLNPAATRTQASVDLSAAAIAARQLASEGNLTGAELVARAERVNQRAQDLAKEAGRGDNRVHRARASAAADEALLTAAVQVRLAELTPLGKPYLHALTLEQIQTVKAEVTAAARRDLAALAVDTHRRLRDQRNRIRTEGTA